MRPETDDQGRHVFAAGDGRTVTMEAGLDDRHIRFLSRNPAAVRVCALVGTFTLPWLDRLMADVALIDASGTGSLH